MNLITIDLETFYDQDFSLSKITTEEYVRSSQFEVIGVGVKVNNEPAQWASGPRKELGQWLKQFPFESSMVLAHNTMFDGAILKWHFGIDAKIWADTLCMGRALHGVEVGASLKAMAERYDVGVKGTEVLNAKGKRRADFTEEELSRYGDYCLNDVDITYKLFGLMVPSFPRDELRLIDLTLRMFIDPVLEVDEDLMRDHLRDIQLAKQELLSNTGVDKAELLSNPKFAALLRGFGIIPPTKISLTTGKETLALAKNDEEFKALAEHPDIRVQALVAARLGTKSTLEETRTERFLDISSRGALPIPLRYYAAHTGRWGGDDKINMQNLPSRGEHGGKIKRGILAPEGYVVIDSDSSQIEARTLAWLAGQDDLLTAFTNGEDVYKIMASAIYNKPVEEVSKAERFVGKTVVLGCFGANTKVLTHTGWKRIVEVLATDKVWDGEEWVTHRGVIPQGEKETIQSWGVDATPDHEILTEHGWREWQEVVTNPTLSQSAFSKGSLLSPTGRSTLKIRGDLPDGILLSDVYAGGWGKWTGIISKLEGLHDATPARKKRPTLLAKSIGGMKLFSPTWSIVNDCLTASQVSLHDVIQKLAGCTRTMAGAVLRCMNLGVPTEQLSYATYLPLKAGTNLPATLTASITIKGMNRATYGLQRGPKTPATNEALAKCRKKSMTYDIAYAGPRNRFMIATDAGPLIVHNCGYGMGAAKFQAALKTTGVEIELDEARHIINVYRATNDKIVGLWGQAQRALKGMVNGEPVELGREGVLKAINTAIKLPSGLLMRYDELKVEPGEKGPSFLYRTRKGFTYIYGGKVVENVCQAVARCIIGEQMLRIAKRYRVVMTVHDAIACIAPEAEAEEAMAYVMECMRWTPKWARGLPLNCEAGFSRRYGDC